MMINHLEKLGFRDSGLMMDDQLPSPRLSLINISGNEVERPPRFDPFEDDNVFG